jgi:2-keto-4-pentenoate hydratase/2-oxohepta-3-ene-1,7-dioic acid hydratase in catechol pathway
MRLVSFLNDGDPSAAILLGDRLVPSTILGASSSVRALLAQSDADSLRELAARAANAGAESTALSDVRLCAPVPDPQKIICIGLNYRDHAEETGQDIPAAPM